MNPNSLAGLVAAAIVIGSIVAWAITRHLTSREPTPAAGVLVVVAWTVLVAGIPYAIFAIAAPGARGHGRLSSAGRLVIGLMPILLVAAPLVALIYALRHFARHIRDNFDPDAAPSTKKQKRGSTNG